MNATATKTFVSLTDFVLTAAPGDVFTETKNRSTSTYTALATEGVTDSLMERCDKVISVDIVTTSHYGRAEYVGRPDYCYLTYRTVSEPIGVTRFETGGSSVTRRYALQHSNQYLMGREDAKRFSAKTMAAIHAGYTAAQQD